MVEVRETWIEAMLEMRGTFSRLPRRNGDRR
jgi:hypothetical protein